VRPRLADAADHATYPQAREDANTMTNPMQSLSSLNPAKKAFSLFDEFKNFAFRGNVIDLAVGVIIGAAFGGIVKSLVEDIFMPLVGLVLPGAGYQSWQWNGVKYGAFLGQLVNFLIIALILFVFIVKFLGWIMHFKKEEAVAPPPPTKDQELLTEIRDLLKGSREASEQA
jgi:large conductance mechanosensitive channel